MVSVLCFQFLFQNTFCRNQECLIASVWERRVQPPRLVVLSDTVFRNNSQQGKEGSVRVSGEIVPLVQQDFHCYCDFSPVEMKCEPFVLLGIFHLCLEKKSRCQSLLSHPSFPHPLPPSVSLTSDVWSHSALARLVSFQAMERKKWREGKFQIQCVGFHLLFAATVFLSSLLSWLEAWIPHPVLRQTEGEFFCVC